MGRRLQAEDAEAGDGNAGTAAAAAAAIAESAAQATHAQAAQALPVREDYFLEEDVNASPGGSSGALTRVGLLIRSILVGGLCSLLAPWEVLVFAKWVVDIMGDLSASKHGILKSVWLPSLLATVVLSAAAPRPAPIASLDVRVLPRSRPMQASCPRAAWCQTP